MSSHLYFIFVSFTTLGDSYIPSTYGTSGSKEVLMKTVELVDGGGLTLSSYYFYFILLL